MQGIESVKVNCHQIGTMHRCNEMINELVHTTLEQSMSSEPSLKEVGSGINSTVQRMDINLVRQACKET